MDIVYRAGSEEITTNQENGTAVSNVKENQELELIVQLVEQIRPKNPKDCKTAEIKFKTVLQQLQSDPKALHRLQHALQLQFQKRSFVPVLTLSGIIESRGFIQEIVKKVKHKILPPLLEEDDFLYVINHVFYKHKDHIWAQGINKQLWMELFELIGIQLTYLQDTVLKELNEALHILAQHAITLGLEKEIMGSYLKINYTEYSFFSLDQAVQQYLLLYKNREEKNKISEAVSNIVDAIQKCRQTISDVSKERKKRGTSLAQTYTLIRTEQFLDRLLLITELLDCDNCFDTERLTDYFLQVIAYEKKRNSIREFISANFAFLTYKITEHGGTRGKKYITVTRQEYWSMMKSSMGGGFFVSFTALVKHLLSKLALPPFWLYFSYSLNYAAGFQIMHETKTTLATKQPAYTASAIASSVEYFKAYEKHGFTLIAIIVARTARTQLASFFGNLVIVFPMAYALAALYHNVTGNLLLDNKAALYMLEGQHPFYSLSILYACFTGFFLFLSGLIAGYIENDMNYGNIGQRLRNSPVLTHTLSPGKRNKLAAYIENNLGALVGNISLGFFLGMAGFFGKIFGIPFDIRHITIASGNAAMAYYTTGNAPGIGFLLTVFCGILLIGLFNFLVSFALAFTVAVRSRGIRMRDYPEIVLAVSKYFIRYPLDFFFPPKSEIKKTST